MLINKEYVNIFKDFFFILLRFWSKDKETVMKNLPTQKMIGPNDFTGEF